MSKRAPIVWPNAVPSGKVVVEFNLSVDLAEVAKWKPETARALFAGIALVISAQQD